MNMKEKTNNTTNTMSTTSSSSSSNATSTSSSNVNTGSTVTSSNGSNTTTLDNQNFLSPYNNDNFMAPTIGSIVRCTTCLGNTVQGKVLAYDQQTKMLALKTNKAQMWDISLINVGWFTSFDVIEKSNEAPEQLPTLNLQKLERRIRLSVDKKNKEISSIGNGVTRLAQHLYYTILKTLNDVQWDDKKIIVMNSVVIEPPYDVNNCLTLPGQSSQALDHVKKIVKKFHDDYKSLENESFKLQSLSLTDANINDDSLTSSKKDVSNISTSSLLSPSSPPPTTNEK